MKKENAAIASSEPGPVLGQQSQVVFKCYKIYRLASFGFGFSVRLLVSVSACEKTRIQ